MSAQLVCDRRDSVESLNCLHFGHRGAWRACRGPEGPRPLYDLCGTSMRVPCYWDSVCTRCQTKVLVVRLVWLCSATGPEWCVRKLSLGLAYVKTHRGFHDQRGHSEQPCGMTHACLGDFEDGACRNMTTRIARGLPTSPDQASSCSSGSKAIRRPKPQLCHRLDKHQSETASDLTEPRQSS